ncbi:OprD family porin, partial [Listeria monocytogenes]|nr:OprD family porin [Listeria monocytogenes]
VKVSQSELKVGTLIPKLPSVQPNNGRIFPQIFEGALLTSKEIKDLGFTAGRGSQIGSSAARAWSVGPRSSWAAFALGSVRARRRGAKADADAALASYEQQVLLALEESANAF